MTNESRQTGTRMVLTLVQPLGFVGGYKVALVPEEVPVFEVDYHDQQFVGQGSKRAREKYPQRITESA